ncbi:MAG TPA: outer membrane beta-barrel protein [Bacteriovoracaceae bacterium]|nr:outer membrane beta-barrel protein [Bacteriovoracaceae bacterium]
MDLNPGSQRITGLINGWQNIAENNQGKALGFQYKNIRSNAFTFTYNNFWGEEKVTGTNSRFRGYHDLIFQYKYSAQWQTLWALDFGHQSQQTNDGIDIWYGTAYTIRRILNPAQAIALRLEYYNDRHQANVMTNTSNGFQVAGASINFDHQLAQRAMWRTELRGFHSVDKIFPKGKNLLDEWDGFLVTSLGLSL